MANTATTGALAHTFTFSSQALRVIMRNGDPWFVAADVCAALTIGNVTDALKRLDDDEQTLDSIEGISRGNDRVNLVNESGLYVLILGSRKPEAKKFKKWVTSEVLPSIRKTGAYVAPNAPQATTTPAHVNERLTGADLQNIKRMIWNASHGFNYESSWNQAIWFYLRMVLDLPSPQPFGVDHLPTLAVELQRINAITSQVHDVINEIERDAAKRIFRKGESADVVVADLRRLATVRMAEVKDDLEKLPSYLQRDIAAITTRQEPGYYGHLAYDEKPGYFDKASA